MGSGLQGEAERTVVMVAVVAVVVVGQVVGVAVSG